MPVAPEISTALSAAQLRTAPDPALLDFATTDELQPIESVIGQDRAVEALGFGISIKHEGFNLFALGPQETGMRDVVRRTLDARAAKESAPDDWVYVHNFADPRRPRAIALPAGRGTRLQADMERLVDEIKAAIRTAFQTDEYRARAQVIEEEVKERHDTALRDIEQRAQERNIALVRMPLGMGFAPVKDGEVVGPKDFAQLPESERERVAKEIAELQDDLQAVAAKFPQWQREGREKMRALNREVTGAAVGHLIDELRGHHGDIAEVATYLDQLQADIIDNAMAFRMSDDAQAAPQDGASIQQASGPQGADQASNGILRRYRVNLLVGHDPENGAPVVYEPNPSYQNLVGRIEHMAQMGALSTDFNLIRPGALHKANGGYLLLDARKILTQAYAWEGLKQALVSSEIRIESLGQIFSVVSTVSLEPTYVPLRVKVILLGDPMLYYLLAQYDPEFSTLFKVAVDFDDQMARSAESTQLYARQIASQARAAGLRPLNAGAVGLVIEESARLAGDAEKLSTRMRAVVDLLAEADHGAEQRGSKLIETADIQGAIDAAIHRSDRIRERMQEQTERGTIMIDTDGAKIGQINGLSVLQMGGFAFGRPSRITARVRMGRGQVVDIEREVELGGPLHSKGVLILSNFLAARYASDQPLSLAASLVFEQSYGGVDGDSASSAELYALLSALSGLPIQQSLAVTGSVNQRGEVQAIGGVNEKIEGFYDLCRVRGLDGSHGVLIPEANVKHLMLRRDVVDAAAAGQFHVFPIRTIDQGIAVLTGAPAGEADANGHYPDGSVNRRVADRLHGFFEQRLRYGRMANVESNDEKTA